ncbi:hypothetical protein M2351_006785 [Azospirillum canadense]|nr:hypothetical protein [Azospirillum canadense]
MLKYIPRPEPRTSMIFPALSVMPATALLCAA